MSGGPTGSYLVPAGIHKIKHVIVIEQENRSFDSYFGTYPGADGIPMKHGVPDRVRSQPGHRWLHTAIPTTRPTSTAAARTARPTRSPTSTAGKMDGFIAQRDAAKSSCTNPNDPACYIGSGNPRRHGLSHGG